jgi:hypothetical protein
MREFMKRTIIFLSAAFLAGCLIGTDDSSAAPAAKDVQVTQRNEGGVSWNNNIILTPSGSSLFGFDADRNPVAVPQSTFATAAALDAAIISFGTAQAALGAEIISLGTAQDAFSVSLSNALAELQGLNTSVAGMQPRLMPTGGTAGQVLVKNSNSNYDTSWLDVTSGSSSTGPGDYNTLINRPEINGTLLAGSLTLAQLGIAPAASLNDYLPKVSGPSRFFNESDGGGLVYLDSGGREVAGITLNENFPQLYTHTYNESGVLTNRVLVEVHSDGLYMSKSLTGAQWVPVGGFPLNGNGVSMSNNSYGQLIINTDDHLILSGELSLQLGSPNGNISLSSMSGVWSNQNINAAGEEGQDLYLVGWNVADAATPKQPVNKSQLDAVASTIPPPYTLPTASATTLGGVKVGANLSINSGTLSALYPINQPAYNSVPLSTILANSASITTAGYFAVSASTTFTFENVNTHFTLRSIDGASRFEGGVSGVFVYYQDVEYANLTANGDSYTFVGPALFRGLDGFTGDISEIFVTQPPITTGLEDVAATIANAATYNEKVRANKADRFPLTFNQPVNVLLANASVGDNLSGKLITFDTTQVIPIIGPAQDITFSDGSYLEYSGKHRTMNYMSASGQETAIYSYYANPAWLVSGLQLGSSSIVSNVSPELTAFESASYQTSANAEVFMNLDRALFSIYPEPQTVNSDLLLLNMGTDNKSAATREFVLAQAGAGGFPLNGDGVSITNPDTGQMGVSFDSSITFTNNNYQVGFMNADTFLFGDSFGNSMGHVDGQDFSLGMNAGEISFTANTGGITLSGEQLTFNGSSSYFLVGPSFIQLSNPSFFTLNATDSETSIKAVSFTFSDMEDNSVVLSGVANGVYSNDAVNKSQLDAVAASAGGTPTTFYSADDSVPRSGTELMRTVIFTSGPTNMWEAGEDDGIIMFINLSGQTVQLRTYDGTNFSNIPAGTAQVWQSTSYGTNFDPY